MWILFSIAFSLLVEVAQELKDCCCEMLGLPAHILNYFAHIISLSH